MPHKNAIILVSISIAVLFSAAVAATYSVLTPVVRSPNALGLPDAAAAASAVNTFPLEEENISEQQVISEVVEIAEAIETAEPKNQASLPSHLQIPSIGVNATIEPLGLTPDGNMDMTQSAKNVAWYNLGPKPGQAGSAVIGGHYGYPGPAVFYNLTNLKLGDVVIVTDSNGLVNKFRVKETGVYKATDIVSEVFFSNDGLAHLNLVTCNGNWVSSLQTYDKRFVVFTDLIP